MGNDVVRRLRTLVKRRDRRKDNSAHFGYGGHIADVAEVQRRFPGQQHQAATFFQHHVCRAGEQVVGQAVGDGA